jgi:hypothetical protein
MDRSRADRGAGGGWPQRKLLEVPNPEPRLHLRAAPSLGRHLHRGGPDLQSRRWLRLREHLDLDGCRLDLGKREREVVALRIRRLPHLPAFRPGPRGRAPGATSS